eukprot:COSAG01_NODE_64667_length_275_cov_7.977273_1_plen_32_part_10
MLTAPLVLRVSLAAVAPLTTIPGVGTRCATGA